MNPPLNVQKLRAHIVSIGDVHRLFPVLVTAPMAAVRKVPIVLTACVFEVRPAKMTTIVQRGSVKTMVFVVSVVNRPTVVGQPNASRVFVPNERIVQSLQGTLDA